MTFIKRLNYILFKNDLDSALVKASNYRNINSKKEIENYQVNKFNKVWHDAFKNIEFYSEWKNKHSLPDSIKSINELDDWPVLSKSDIQSNYDKFNRKGIKPDKYISTGGSTGEPLKLPSWLDRDTRASMLLGRVGYGILPGDKTFMLWGHHHLYGVGIKKIVNRSIRWFKDKLLNIKRVSAYDLSPTIMQENLNIYNKFNPDFVIGFSPAILSFVRSNSKNSINIKKPKAVLCTAGPLNKVEIKEIERFFNAPVCMEYGSVECGVMGYTNPIDSTYNIFWDTHLIQGLNDGSEVRNIVTRLQHCYVPLIRYDIGDYLSVSNEEKLCSILKVNYIAGRPSDIIKLPDGTSFFVALIGDSIKQNESVTSWPTTYL